MSATVTINSASLDRKLAKFAILGQKTLDEALTEGARRFTTQSVRNTMPMVLSKNPSQVKAEWTTRVTHHFETHRITKKGYQSDASLRRMLAKKKKSLGREAAGWNAAAVELKANRIPAWVKRHGTGEGSCRSTRKKDRITIIITNSVPYNEAMTMRRAAYVLDKVERGFAGNLRALKRKLIRSCR
ncbi:MAG: hypothetical protein IJ956_06910 [Akkermansia sp.]|nr:hypothetical protein [Akkermansia sp.]